ncbi:MAG: DUF1674 domain-containing protein [Xanthobacteraceae bacterium]|nr:DUF1674 domain-containing protein [Xanthobacteraceae bacterium]
MSKSSPVPAGANLHDDEAPPPGRHPLSPTAQRALAEAEARRAEIDRRAKDHPREVNGRRGPEPIRYGDWEIKGLASDF